MTRNEMATEAVSWCFAVIGLPDHIPTELETHRYLSGFDNFYARGSHRFSASILLRARIQQKRIAKYVTTPTIHATKTWVVTPMRSTTQFTPNTTGTVTTQGLSMGCPLCVGPTSGVRPGGIIR